MSVNKAIILGRIGVEPKFFDTANGGKIARLSVATSEKWKDKATGEQKEKTDWHNIVFFGRRAEIIESYFNKGDMIYVEGKIRNTMWEKEGTKHYAVEIHADNFSFIPKAKGSNSTPTEPKRFRDLNREEMVKNDPGKEYVKHEDKPPTFDFDDDIPF